MDVKSEKKEKRKKGKKKKKTNLIEILVSVHMKQMLSASGLCFSQPSHAEQTIN